MPYDSPSDAASPATVLSTYRLQFHAGFTLRHALELVDYLERLGVSHVYASPLLKARPGSTHGYDIVDHDQINPEIGTPEDFDAFAGALAARGMGLILDIVPNHMGVGGKDNAWWLDTLEWGEDSPVCAFFDIDFKTNRRGLRGKVMVPVLADQYGKVLARGELGLKFDASSGSFSAWYFDHRLPIDPRHYPLIFADAPRLPPAGRELAVRFAALEQLGAEAHREGQAAKAELAQKAQADAALTRALSEAAQAYDGVPGQLDSWMRLHGLLEKQSYRVAYYRAAADEINYRRFFNINDLAGVRIELEELFELTHRRVLGWVQEGKVQGLRVDHIDGLFDPRRYCERLAAGSQLGGRSAYLVVEKILAPHERLPDNWLIAGTSGYDTLNLINGVFVDPSGEKGLDRIYRSFTRRRETFDELVIESKKLIMENALGSEMNVLANELHRLSSSDLMSRDFTLRAVRDAIEDVLAHMPVYRTYVTPEGSSEQDQRYIDWAIGKARKASSATDTSIFDFLHGVLSGSLARGHGYDPGVVLGVAMRAQQISGPVMAKGVEDTAFYRHLCLISLNEVGGDPSRFGVSLPVFHRVNAERRERWPHDMLAGSTHDTKRGEDARARINVLSELPREWARQVRTWTRSNRSRRTESAGAEPMPNALHEYLFYQSVVGAWPLELTHDDTQGLSAFAERVAQFMQKAVREGKERSSWDNPNVEYEQALDRFVREALQYSTTNPFPEQIEKWVRTIARAGAINSLGQTLLRLTIPGVPDTYRGAELWDTSLVDPDNRRPVDYSLRRGLLSLVERMATAVGEPSQRRDALRQLREGWEDGREKLYLVRSVLRFRRAHPAVFLEGSYSALAAAGSHADHVCAFERATVNERVVVVVPRFIARLQRADASCIDWLDTTLTLTPGRYHCLLSGAELDASTPVPLARLLEDFPVALLVAG